MRWGPFLVPWTTTGTEGEPGPEGHSCTCRLSPSGPIARRYWSPPWVTVTAPEAGTGGFPGPARHKRPSQPPSAEVNAAGAVMNGRSRRPPPAPGHLPAPTAGPSRWAVVSRGCPLALLLPTPSAEPGGTGRGRKPGLLADSCRKGSPGRASRHPVGCRPWQPPERENFLPGRLGTEPLRATSGSGRSSSGAAAPAAPAAGLQLSGEPGGYRGGSGGTRVWE